MSIAGGLHKAVEAARQHGCDCVQVFTKNSNQWRAKAITAAEVERFRSALQRCSITHPIAHDSYLINLAAPDEQVWRKSVEAFIVELRRADQLGIAHLVTHPGAFTTSSEAAGLARVIRALDQAHAQTRGIATKCLLENTAGQGTSLGWRFEHLAKILDGVRDPERLGVCLDTCHLFAAGYPLAPAGEYRRTLRQFDRLVGLARVGAWHLNDSKKPLGSRVDRHEHIGRGFLGLEPFRLLLNDRRFRRIPMYLETEHAMHEGRHWVEIDLAVLRGLVKQR